MKKIILLLVLAFFGVSVYAQTGKYFYFLAPLPVEQEQSKVQEYDKFDHYYYDYARSFFSRKSAYKHLDFVRDFRRNVWGRAAVGDLQKIYEEFDSEWSQLLKDVPLTYRETFVISEYKNRPETRERMLQKKEWYQEYDDLVYQSMETKLTSNQAKIYLQKAYDFRKGVVNFDDQIEDLYAQLRYVLDKTHGYQSLDNMSEEERDLIEQYLSMPVSVENKGNILPLDDYLGRFRSKLSAKERKNYPSQHYK